MIDHIDRIMRCLLTHDTLQNTVVAADGRAYTRTAYKGKEVPSNGDGRLQGH